MAGIQFPAQLVADPGVASAHLVFGTSTRYPHQVAGVFRVAVPRLGVGLRENDL